MGMFMNRRKENWWSENWRPMSALVYLLICMFDFIIMPTVYEISNKKIDQASVVEYALRFSEPAVQSQVIETMSAKRAWSPITLEATGLLHIAFGALLTGAAWTRGQEKIEQIRSGNNGYYGGGYQEYSQYQSDEYTVTPSDNPPMSDGKGKPIKGAKPVAASKKSKPDNPDA